MTSARRFETVFDPARVLRESPEAIQAAADVASSRLYPAWVERLGTAIREHRTTELLLRGGIAVPLIDDGARGTADGIAVVRCRRSTSEVTLPTLQELVVESPVVGDILASVADLGRSLCGEAWLSTCEFAAPRPVCGLSFGLATVLAALAAHLRIELPGDLAATGVWDSAHRSIQPVDPASLPRKAEVLRRWGFRRLVVVDEQLGADVVRSSELDVVRLPSELIALAVRSVGLGSTQDDERLAALLIHAFIRSGGSDRRIIEDVRRAALNTEVGRPPILKLACAWMAACCAAHAGDSSAADGFAKEARRLEKCVPLPEGRTGDVLRDRMAAQRSIISVDVGRWDCRLEEHRAVDRLIRRHRASDWRRPHETFMLHALMQTRARRLLYRARIRRDLPGCLRAIQDAADGHENWSELLDRRAVEEWAMTDSSRRRAENLVIDCSIDVLRLGGTAGDCPIPFDRLWPLREDLRLTPAPDNDFDVLGWIRGRLLAGAAPKTMGEIERLLLERGRSGPIGSPLTSVTEELLVGELHGRWALTARTELGALLASSRLFASRGDSILCLLAARAASVLRSVQLPSPQPPQPTLDSLVQLDAILAAAEYELPDARWTMTPY